MPVRVPVKVRHDGSESAGLTRDLSSSGIFLYSESEMKVGSKLELVIMLPPGLGLGPGGWTLCEASVVRVEPSDGKGIGIAATIRAHRIAAANWLIAAPVVRSVKAPSCIAFSISPERKFSTKGKRLLPNAPWLVQ